MDGTPTIAVLPPVNLSREEQAGDIIGNNVVVELLQARQFLVTDPGLVENIVVKMRLRLTDRLPLETLREIGEELDVTYVMMGTVNEFGTFQARGGDLPGVSITLRIVTCANGRIVWRQATRSAATTPRRYSDWGVSKQWSNSPQ